MIELLQVFHPNAGNSASLQCTYTAQILSAILSYFLSVLKVMLIHDGD